VGGATLSFQATLTVLTPVAFSLQPTNQNVQPGTNVTLAASAFGVGPIRYQWQHESTNIFGATNSSYSFVGATLTNHGNYRVIATDDYGSVASSNAFIFVLIRPGFVVQPRPQTVLEGKPATFSVVVTGAPPIYYRWIRNGVPIETNLSAAFVFKNNFVSGNVRVAVTNLATGPGGINSDTVPLTVIPDHDEDGIPDAWEVQHGMSTNFAQNATQDWDGDGMNNREEYVAGTDPVDAASVLRLVLSATNSAALRFIARTNVSYTVQYQTNLWGGTWSNLTSFTAFPVQRLIEVIVPRPNIEPPKAIPRPPAEDARVYRVVTPMEP
jgi:hypothetical protein